MRVVARACALGCLAVVFVGRPAAASMTLGFRDGSGQTQTFYQDGSRVRIANPSGTDEGEARIVDLKTSLNILVYDDAKTYFDFNKTAAAVRAAVERERKAHPAALRRAANAANAASAASYRALGQTRTVNGFSCTMYERVVAGRVEGEVCFAPWGGAIGPREDFAWFDAFMVRMVADVAGEWGRAAIARSRDTTKPGLAVWESSIADGGSRDVLEVVKLSRDPLPATMFQVPSDYKEFSRPLTASEHQPIAAPRAADVTARRVTSPSPRRISGMVAILLAVMLLFGLFVHACILHLAAKIVLEHPLFRQALVAAAINTGVLIAFELIPLPPVLTLGLCAFGAFAGLKISYGAGVGRTLGLLFVVGLISALLRFAGHVFFLR